jgi:hypothetical protein
VRIVDHRERVFQVWAYTVGMGRLLLRSSKNETFGTRVDVLFQNVRAMKLPTLLDGLVVTVAAGALPKETCQHLTAAETGPQGALYAGSPEAVPRKAGANLWTPGPSGSTSVRHARL